MQFFQTFNLDEELMYDSAPWGELVKKDLPGKSKQLIQLLKEKGYKVFESEEIRSGVPKSLLIATDEIPKDFNPKNDFYSIAKELELTWFKPGAFYTEISKK